MLKFALVGCGRIAKRHSDLLGHGEIDGAQLVAVCDLDLERAKAIAEKFDVPYFTDMHEMMAKIEPDVVSVLTDSGSHADVVVALAPYGKHIVVEKPIALTLDDVDRMITTCDLNGVKLFVVQSLAGISRRRCRRCGEHVLSYWDDGRCRTGRCGRPSDANCDDRRHVARRRVTGLGCRWLGLQGKESACSS